MGYLLVRIGGAAVVLVVSMAAVGARGDAVDDYLRAAMHQRHVPGLAVAVVKEGRVEKLAGYGVANVEQNTPVTARTVFQIQSITKTFTSSAILLLAEEGKLSVADPIGKHLEGTPESWKAVTLGHLLSHRSGIKDFINEPTANIRLEVSEGEVFKAAVVRPLNFLPGEKYAYSNTNYHLLAMVVRRVTGKAYGEFLTERVFGRLGMGDTRIVSLSEVIPNRAAGYAWERGGLRNGGFVAESVLAYGGGGVVSSAADMAKWAVAFDGESVLKKGSLEAAWIAPTFKDGKVSPYGLGWNVGVVNGHRFVGHSGAHLTGFTSHFVRYRDDGLSVVVLANASGAAPWRMARRVAGMYVAALAPAGPAAIEDKEPGVTQLLRDVLARVGDGRLEAARFTPALWAVIEPQLKELGEQSRLDGAIGKVELLSRKEVEGRRAYRYRVGCAARTQVIDLEVAGDGKVSLWRMDEE